MALQHSLDCPVRSDGSGCTCTPRQTMLSLETLNAKMDGLRTDFDKLLQSQVALENRAEVIETLCGAMREEHKSLSVNLKGYFDGLALRISNFEERYASVEQFAKACERLSDQYVATAGLLNTKMQSPKAKRARR